jgi:hypothetical protein
MAEIGRVPLVGDATLNVQTVTGEGGGRREQHREPSSNEGGPPPGSEELAVALSEEGRGTMTPQLEENEDGDPVIRIVDSASGETVAVVTPEELRELSEQTGLPAGMLLEARS